MNGPDAQDWDPGTYGRFRGLRLRPALDLLAQVPALPPGDIIDLGCGSGAAGPVLRERFGGRRIIGIDASPAMLEEAARTGSHARLEAHDATGWAPEAAPALIFSNALCHWLPDHGGLFPRLAGYLAPGGALAVQMPRQFDAPSHRLLREVAGRLWPERFDFGRWTAPVAAPEAYGPILDALGRAEIWETEYLQYLDPVTEGHPVRHFTRSTAMRPIAAKLNDDEAAAFIAAYDAALSEAYPLLPDGRTLMPFRRLFFVVTRPS